MNRNVMIVLAGGFLIAVLVALLVQAGLSGGKQQAAVPAVEEAKVEIVVASADIKTGAELNDTNMKWQSWPKSGVFPGAYVREGDKKVTEVVTGRLLRDMKTGEPIVESALVKDTQGNFIAAALDEGMRAVAIKTDASGMVGGFVTPGDFVDVLLTYDKDISYEGIDDPDVDNMIQATIESLATETIMQNVKVLAVDQSPTRDEEGKIKVGKTVTLEVDFRGAETLALAGKMGTLSLALRRLGDEKIVQASSVTTDSRVTNIIDEIFKQIEMFQDSTGQGRNNVRIYRGEMAEDMAVRP